MECGVRSVQQRCVCGTTTTAAAAGSVRIPVAKSRDETNPAAGAPSEKAMYTPEYLSVDLCLAVLSRFE